MIESTLLASHITFYTCVKTTWSSLLEVSPVHNYQCLQFSAAVDTHIILILICFCMKYIKHAKAVTQNEIREEGSIC